MSLYHSYDKQFRLLQESWKKVQEDGSEDRVNQVVIEANRKVIEAIRLMKEAEKIYDSAGAKFANHQMEASKVLYAMEDMEDFLNRLTGSRLYGENDEVGEAQDIHSLIQSSINAPFKRSKTSKLGSSTAYPIYISLDPKEEWPNGIYENSRYLTFMYSENDGVLELLSKDYKIPVKFRKTRVKNLNQLIEKLNNYIQMVESHGQEA